MATLRMFVVSEIMGSILRLNQLIISRNCHCATDITLPASSSRWDRHSALSTDIDFQLRWFISPDHLNITLRIIVGSLKCYSQRFSVIGASSPCPFSRCEQLGMAWIDCCAGSATSWP
jgi:hypothetical protein